MTLSPPELGRPLSVSLRRDFLEVEDGGGYQSFSGTVEFLGAGSWQVSWRRESPAAQALFSSVFVAGEDPCRWGLVVREQGNPAVVFSGPLLSGTLTEGAGDGTAGESLTAYGMTDTGILRGYPAYMTPGTDVPTTAGTNATAYDTRTGPGETVLLGYISANAGPAAGVARRQVASMVVPASLGRGTSTTYKARFTDLLEVARDIHTRTGVGVQLRQGGRNQLLVEPVVTQPRPGLVWSVDAGTLSGASWKRSAVTATDTIAGGRDELTTRNFVRSSAPAVPGGFGFRRERFVAATNVEDAADLKQAANDALNEAAAVDEVTVTPTEQALWRYGVDYALGDEVTVTVWGADVSARIGAVTVSHSSGGVPSWTPRLGEWSQVQQSTVARRIARQLAQQVRA